MKILVIGGGGREHALVWKIAQSPLAEKIFAIPGSDAIGRLAECVNLKGDDLEGLADFAEKGNIDLTVVGPENPLVRGVVDVFKARGLRIVGPSAEAAQIEGSKGFSKRLMHKYGIPTASFKEVTNPEDAVDAVDEIGLPVAIKADGLAAGKGVILCHTEEEAKAAIDQIMVTRDFGSAGNLVVVEKLLTGEEASFIALTDGKTVLPMASSQDHKQVFDGDTGPNTGGMGAYSPAPVVSEDMHRLVMEELMIPTVKAMEREGYPFSGILYAGLMIQDGEPSVLEFNARFGDPETQPILARLKSDLVELLVATADGTLDKHTPVWDSRPAVCVVMASGGYPGSAEKGFRISGIEDAEEMDDIVVFHAGTKFSDGEWLNNGGRVLGVTALGENIEEATARTYAAVKAISWRDVHYRKDIARKAFGRM